jgi:hypothetical protein
MRYRVEIYDDVKQNDITIPMANRINRDKLNELVKGNLNKFVGDVRAYQFDTKTNKKTVAMILPRSFYKSA